MEIDEAVASARDLFDAGHYAGVVAVCSQSLERWPRQGTLLLLRARAWISLGRAAAAIDDLRAALAIDPRSGSAYRALGRLLLHQGELESARRAFLAALTLDEGDDEARSQLTAVDAALAVEAALALEALALEEALALADDTGEVPEGGVPGLARASAPRIAALRRMPTQPMPRASTSAAIWRAPTMPLDLALASIEDERDDPSPGGRAATQRMERATTSAAPWRAPTMPLIRPTRALPALPPRPDDETAHTPAPRFAARTPPPAVSSLRPATAPFAPGARGAHGRAGTAPTPARASTVPFSRGGD